MYSRVCSIQFQGLLRLQALHHKVLCMTTLTPDPDAIATVHSIHERVGDMTRPEFARRVLVHALLLGIAGDALLRGGPDGLGFPLWIALAVLSAIAMTWRARRALPVEASAWLATALLFAAAIAWRDSATLVFFDFIAAVGAVTLAGVALARPRAALFAERLRDTVWGVASLVGEIIVGLIPLALRDVAGGQSRRNAARVFPTALRAVALSGALLLVFGALLRSADPIFASLIRLPEFDMLTLVSHVFLVGFFTATTAGWARGALMSREVPDRAPAAPLIRIGVPEVTSALGTLLVLFGAFVAVQFGWLFGGERFLQERTGLTAAEYARQGFFQVMWVVALVVPVLVATRAALDPLAGAALRRRHTRLALPIIVLLGVMIVSAVLRLRLYMFYFGLTTDRLYPLIAMGWLAFVLVWLARTVLRDRGQPFVAGLVVSGLVTLAVLNLVPPDALVARINVQRAKSLSTSAAHPLDIRYLATLGGEAASVATQATLSPPNAMLIPGTEADSSLDMQRCDAARHLLRQWGPSSAAVRRQNEDAPWRWWNAERVDAMRVVNANAMALLAVQHETCPRARARERSAASRVQR